jgi:hypothetical protein
MNDHLVLAVRHCLAVSLPIRSISSHMSSTWRKSFTISLVEAGKEVGDGGEAGWVSADSAMRRMVGS